MLSRYAFNDIPQLWNAAMFEDVLGKKYETEFDLYLGSSTPRLLPPMAVQEQLSGKG